VSHGTLEKTQSFAPFAYGTIALYGRLFQAVWLGAKFVTLCSRPAREIPAPNVNLQQSTFKQQSMVNLQTLKVDFCKLLVRTVVCML